MWYCFKLIGEENLLASETEKTIHQDFQELRNRPQITTKIIKSLNFVSKEELKKKGIKDRASMVMETEKVFAKRSLIQQARNKCIVVKRNVKLFSNKFNKLIQMDLPTFWSKKEAF